MSTLFASSVLAAPKLAKRGPHILDQLGFLTVTLYRDLMFDEITGTILPIQWLVERCVTRYG